MKKLRVLFKLLKALESMPDDPVISEHVGDVFFELGQINKAREFWENSFEKEVDH